LSRLLFRFAGINPPKEGTTTILNSIKTIEHELLNCIKFADWYYNCVEDEEPYNLGLISRELSLAKAYLSKLTNDCEISPSQISHISGLMRLVAAMMRGQRFEFLADSTEEAAEKFLRLISTPCEDVA